jgi:metallo-beta-lactamase class B
MNQIRRKIATRAILLAVLASLIRAPLLAADAGDPRVSVNHLTGPLYLVEENVFGKTNSLIYIGPTHVTVVGATSTPQTAALLTDQIKRLTRLPISEVIDTSPDPEWSGGNAYWKSIGAKIIANKVTYELLRNTWPATVESARQYHPGYPRLPLVQPTVIHRGNFKLQNGNVQTLYLGPSHTAGDIFVYFPKEKVLDAGSILKEQLGNLAKADIPEYPNTLHKLQALGLDINTIISGHWSAVHGPELVGQYLQLLKLHEQQSEHGQQ